MKLYTPRGLISQPVYFNLHIYPSRHHIHASPDCNFRQHSDGDFKFISTKKHRRISVISGQVSDSDDKRRISAKTNRRSSISAGQNSDLSDDERRKDSIARRRDVIVAPLIAIGASVLKSAVARADEKSPESVAPVTTTPENTAGVAVEKKTEEVINSRIYDASAIGEPMALGKDKTKVWERLMNARIVYLGEAEQVPIRDDKELELEIVKTLRKKCFEAERSISLALEAFPCDLQEQLNKFVDGRITGETLKTFVPHWPPQRWQEYEPLLNYSRDNQIGLVACGTPIEILRTVQAEGIRGLSKADRKKYAPPAGSGFSSGFASISRRSSMDLNILNPTATFGPSSYLSAQAKVIEDYTMSQNILQAVSAGGTSGMLVVVTGASHVIYGARGSGLPARISKKMQKNKQVVILLDPERQYIRREGEVPVADFLWYSAARPCSRNCFDRAEIARVMNAAGMRRDALPQDLQRGLDLGLVSPEVLQNFFDLEQYPMISELTHRFQGFRERLLADPKFLTRLAIEESISITTTLLAQYGKRKENFFEEIDYVITDTTRGIVVDFFTVWLPAPTLSFLSVADETNVPDSMESLKGLLGSIPDNAFQKSLGGKDWNLSHRVASVIIGGLKLGGVGVISSIGAVAASNILYTVRKFLNPALANNQMTKRSPILKSAAVYAAFLGTSANLRYQVIAGIVEHRISDQFSDQTLLVNMLSFATRTINSYWGTQDLPKYEDRQGIEYIRGTTRSRSVNMYPELQQKHGYEGQQGIEYIQGTKRSRSITMYPELQQKHGYEGQQGIEYIQGTTRSMSINMNPELQQKHGDEGQQGIEYIRGTTRSMSVNMNHELLQKHGNEVQQEMEYIQETTRSHNELQQVYEYEGRQGMEYVQGKTESVALYLERKQRHGYEDRQEMEYIRETTKSDVTMYSEPEPGHMYEDWQGIEYIREPTRSDTTMHPELAPGHSVAIPFYSFL